MASVTDQKSSQFQTLEAETVKNTQAAINASKQAVADATAEITETLRKADGAAAEVISIGRGNIEAFTTAANIWSVGMHDLQKKYLESMQVLIDETQEHLKSLSSAKTVKDAIDMHAMMLRNSAEKAITGNSRLASASVKLAMDTMGPINACVGAAAKRFNRPQDAA